MRCFVTICCDGRQRRFADADAIGLVTAQLLRTARDYGVAIHAYCLMPDHLHLLCEGTAADSDVRRFVHMFKQRFGHDFAACRGERLWQRDYFDRHLRADENLVEVARYIVANPVRAGLVQRAGDYPHAGSGTMSLDEVLASLT